MAGFSIRSASLADEAAVFALLPSLTEGELGAGVPVGQSGAARAVYRELVTGARGSVLVCEIGGDVVGVITSSYVSAIRYGGEYARLEKLTVREEGRPAGLQPRDALFARNHPRLLREGRLSLYRAGTASCHRLRGPPAGWVER